MVYSIFAMKILLFLMIIGFREVPVKVLGVTPHWMGGSRAVVLQDTVKDRYLPIFIGEREAFSIEMALQGITYPRPLTHELMFKVLDGFGIKLEKVVVTNLEENTYFAEIHLNRSGKRRVFDARPSDAIALALRFGSPIYVMEDVFFKAKRGLGEGEGKKSEKL